jgi:hypothetical protein
VPSEIEYDERAVLIEYVWKHCHTYVTNLERHGLKAVGLNMALILDHVLARGWLPDGYEQRDGYRIYRYKDALQ